MARKTCSKENTANTLSLLNLVTTFLFRLTWKTSLETQVSDQETPAEANVLNNVTEAREDLVRRISLLKRNAMAAPFERAFNDFSKLQEEASKFTRESAPEGIAEGGEVMAIHYREEEAIYIKASHDRVTVIFSTIFREETDRIFGKVFLQVSIAGVITERRTTLIER